MGLVMGIADRVSVLDFGKLIADGLPAECRPIPQISAYRHGATSGGSG